MHILMSELFITNYTIDFYRSFSFFLIANAIRIITNMQKIRLPILDITGPFYPKYRIWVIILNLASLK